MEQQTQTIESEGTQLEAATDWRTSLSEELRSAPALQSFKDINGLTKSYLEAHSALGSSLRFPSKEAGAEDRAAFRQKLLERGKEYGVTLMPGEDPAEQEAFYRSLGVPDSEDGYEMPEIEGDDDVHFDPTEAIALRAKAKELGMTTKQYKGIVEAAAKGRMEAARAEVQAARQMQQQLRGEWGEAYETRMGQLHDFLATNGAPKGLVDVVGQGAIDPESARWLYQVMESFGGEAGEISAQGKAGNAAVVTPQEALARADEIFNKLQNMNPGDPDYVTLSKKRVDYIRRAGA